MADRPAVITAYRCDTCTSFVFPIRGELETCPQCGNALVVIAVSDNNLNGVSSGNSDNGNNRIFVSVLVLIAWSLV